ncbi:MAG: hypothetical protein HUU49_02905 [Candidatus Buchananbacteria bacterium]|nr:hypothetical protein [Candidatus Buchananbacteria bacterium]
MTQKTDDFFSLIEQEQKAKAAVPDDEIIFKDEQGNLKILRGDQVLDYEQPVGQGLTNSTSQSSVASKPLTIEPEVEEAVAPVQPTRSFGEPLRLEEEISSVIKNAELHFTSPEDEKKFRSIVSSRLRGIRNHLQTKESLQEFRLTEGTAFDTETINKILAAISRELQDFDHRHRQNISTDQFLELQEEAKKILAEPIIKEVQPIEAKPLFKPEMPADLTPPTPAQPPISPAPTQIADAPVMSRPVVSAIGSKPKIEDVKFKPKLTGPIEEIRTMTLKDFRRLSPTPSMAVQKILDKVALLEDESFPKKVEAIKAWKESEVNRLYLSLGDQSMEEHKPVSEVIAERTQQGLPTLTEEELEAIFDLNKRLRY